MDGNPIRQIALIGFGEVGGIFGQDFASGGIRSFRIRYSAECGPVAFGDAREGEERRMCARATRSKQRSAARTW